MNLVARLVLSVVIAANAIKWWWQPRSKRHQARMGKPMPFRSGDA